MEEIQLIHVHFAFAHLQSNNYGFKCLVVGYAVFSNKYDGLHSQPRKMTVLLFLVPFFFNFWNSKFISLFLQSDNYGFKCLVVGYEGFSNKDDGLRSLEMELSYLGGICAASLMRKVIPLSNPNGYSDAGEVRTLNSLEGNINSPIFGSQIFFRDPQTVKVGENRV